jgi:hypothetical protein
VLIRTADGAIEFPYETVKVEFMLETAWQMTAHAPLGRLGGPARRRR